ncbi:tyrosine-type recombinase/integrase [Streptosporangium sp. NPDC051023]|uniref:tyrosine-type recombinase/integrase n=1 Tax=Streptosporangium sp. NPDC051023 TaxID=3155410 RepID=UPI00344EB5F3
MSTTPAARPSTGLLERLVAVVRPEFRAEVFHPPKNSPVFFQGICRIPSCPTAISFAAKELCQGHYQRWKASPGSDLEAFVAEEDVATLARMTILSCAIRGCQRARKAHTLCHRHVLAWAAAGRPDVETWVGRTLYSPPRNAGQVETTCRVPECERWTDGPNMPLCISHDRRWRWQGRPGLEDFLAELAHGRDPRVRLHDLPRQVRLELQFGLQCRHDEANKLTSIRSVVTAVNWVRRLGVTSLLDYTEGEWRQQLGSHRHAFDVIARVFLLDTRFRLEALVMDGDPWADQYPRDVWDLRHLGFQNEDARHMRFSLIPQPWLRELAKRWCRLRLSKGLAPVTVARDLVNCTAFATHLAAAVPGAQPEDLTRSRLEAWMAALQVEWPTPGRGQRIVSLSIFLKDIHRHEWEARLPSGALIFHDDLPPKKRANPRWIAEHLMRQLEAPDTLALFPHEEGRAMLQIIMACGLRLKDARYLPFECLVRDNSEAPYLAWLNRKMHDRAAFFPVSEALAEVIAAQQRRTLERYPGGCPWLFAALQANLDGKKPASDKAFRNQLGVWLKRIQLLDEHGRPTHITPHQFRHTVGTRLINANVPQHVVQQLLDHMSPQMTAIYARLHNETVRTHWENAVKINADAEPVALPAGHHLADAQWMKISMVRAKVTLPNGYCGAPIQTDCEFANPCLDCHFFLTTRDFIGQHRRQREETLRFISDAERQGLTRIVERNTRTLGKLDRLIEALEQTGPEQIVAGGKVTDLDATG